MKKIIITCHGFTGSPTEVAPLGIYFEKHGWDWENITLPGHGTTPEDLRHTTMQQWLDHVDGIVEQRLADHDLVVFSGLSLGATMMLHVLENYPQVAGGIGISTPIPALHSFFRLTPLLHLLKVWIPLQGPMDDNIEGPPHQAYAKVHSNSALQLQAAIREVNAHTDHITQPVLLVQSKGDHIVHPKAIDTLSMQLPSQHLETMIIEHAGHVITRSKERFEVFEKALAFCKELEDGAYEKTPAKTVVHASLNRSSIEHVKT